jgi:uracil-DNA glycosylase family 4
MPKILSPPRPDSSLAGRQSSRTRSLKNKRNAAQPLTLKKLDDLAKRIRICVKCPLHESRNLAVPGEGKATARFMVIGEAPGKQEDQAGRPFIGNAGRYLDHVLEGTGLERSDFFITNIVKCRPPSNRTPKTLEVETCTSLYLFEQIKLLDPKLILLLGSLAVRTMLGSKSVDEARGRIINHDGRIYLASYHPAARFYREDLAQKIKEDFVLLKTELLKMVETR